LDGTNKEGLLLAVGETSITIQEQLSKKEIKKRKKETGSEVVEPFQILFEDIKQTKEKIVF